jgi:hypothetical protein
MDSRVVFKFRRGDKVRTAYGNVGEITKCVYEINEKDEETKKYYVSFGTYDTRYIVEDELKEYHKFEFTKKYELAFLDFLIDVYLSKDNRNLDLVKRYIQLKKEFEV